MNKKIISILTAAAMSLTTFTALAAVPETLYSTDTEEIKTVLTTISDADKAEFIDKNLSKEMQHLSRLVTLSSNQAVDKIADEVEAALDDGLTPVQIKEAIYHSGAYCGYTRAAKALDAADEKLAAMGIDTTYETRITSTEETRYDDGLAVQRYLFGPQIGTITDGMSDAMKLQTLYLSGICFGDFYNRIGLPLYTREFLTFCTIAGNGNCQGQLTGHTNGNLGVGHSTDMLRAAILLNADINGEEKTEQALGVVNSVEREPSTDVAPEPTERPAIENSDYKSDSEELLGIMEHYATDDKDVFVDANLSGYKNIAINATKAVIDGGMITVEDSPIGSCVQKLAEMTAQGGRENEVPELLKSFIENGGTADMMLAVPLAVVPYNGFPRTLNMMTAINNAVVAMSEETTEPTDEKTVITMQIDNPKMTINGNETDIDDNGTAPVIRDDRTLLPIRAFVEGIGGTVSWNGDTKTATLEYGDTKIELVIDSPIATLNGNERTLDTTPVIINDRTFLPIRFVAESFGYVVSWNGDTKTITIEN